MSRDFPVTGLAELDKYLSALPMNMQKGAYRAGLVAAGGVIRDEARSRAKGRIRTAIKTGSSRQNPDGTFSVRVYVDEKKYYDAYTAFFVEFGVKPHLIARTGKGEGRKAIRAAKDGTGVIQGGVMKIGDDFVSGIIEHPGHAERPFLRPALDTKADEAVKAFADRIRAYIEGKTGFAAPLSEAA